MISKSTQERQERDNPFAYLYPYEFVLLTTFRKNGVGVPTAMWFAHEQGKLYMVTDHKSGKVKRIHNNRRVLLAPCDMMGHILGPQIDASARELPPDRYAHANAILAEKYGEEYETDGSEDDAGDNETFIEIEPVQKSEVPSSRMPGVSCDESSHE
jgi:PPOX class probable F420-dependent enzyme